ncbi:NTP transferase domain-containing protein [Phenylobacterium sp.]|uniref:nucleotidyltransferase family protein n=1 Tax=Phenylobacterium sp. TaxID=1871053 RepID=UPI003983BF70
MATGAGPIAAFEAVVLAAGAGVRFGGGKLLAPWRGGLLIEAALATAFTAPVRGVTVVTGADAEALAAAARAFDPRVRIVHAASHAEGMGASLRCAIASLPEDAQAVFVFLGDMPRVPIAVLEPLAQAVRAGAPAAAPLFAGRRGNPVVLARDLFPDLLALTGDAGARGVLQSLGPALALVEAPDDGVLFDVDQRRDLAG